MMMLLGKRSRPQIKRSTSISGIQVDLSDVEDGEASDLHPITGRKSSPVTGRHHENDLKNYSLSILSPRSQRNDEFLRCCSFCHRRLLPGRDIYMYRGDEAFCSEECRERQMKQDDRKERYGGRVSLSATNSTSAESQTVAAT